MGNQPIMLELSHWRHAAFCHGSFPWDGISCHLASLPGLYCPVKTFTPFAGEIYNTS